MTQDDAFKVLTMGKNVFLTGAAGSGKTHLLRSYIAWMRAREIPFAVTASTGIAATHLGGQTIHSWSGIGIRKRLTEYDIDRIEQDERLVKRFQKTRVLIIDEVSMLSGHTLAMVNASIQAGLRTHEPFGGMQVVLCGDFFQLPPIDREDTHVQFAFENPLWHELQINTCYLTEQFRQNDDDLLTLLNGIREGNVSKASRELLASRVGHTVPEDTPHLYTHNVDVDKLNTKRLSLLGGQPRIFHMSSKGSKGRVEALKKGLLVPEVLTLKKDAVVMFVKNHPQGHYVNGTLGVVTGFNTSGPIVKTHDGAVVHVEPESWQVEDGGKVLAEVTQVPLRLAWAVTIHKSQGLTLDVAFMDLTKTFVAGQGYVALSRVRTLAGLYLTGVSDAAFARHERVAKYDSIFHQNSERTQGRLAKTDPDRIKEISHTFILECGGHEPRGDEPTQQHREVKMTTYDKTLLLLKQGYDLYAIQAQRNLTLGTILSHIEKLLTAGSVNTEDLEALRESVGIADDDFERIATAFAKKGTWNLSPIQQKLNDRYTFEELRIARLFLKPWGKE